jgi:hypothetical protein
VTSPITTFSTMNGAISSVSQAGIAAIIGPPLRTQGSTEPMIATTSATLCPGMMCGRIARFENEAPRHFMRYGFALPSEIMYVPTSPRGPSTRAYASPFGILICATDFNAGRDEIGPAGSLSSACRMIEIA